MRPNPSYLWQQGDIIKKHTRGIIEQSACRDKFVKLWPKSEMKTYHSQISCTIHNKLSIEAVPTGWCTVARVLRSTERLVIVRCVIHKYRYRPLDQISDWFGLIETHCKCQQLYEDMEVRRVR